jgi:phage antirepressor YoqD-like protein
MQNLINTEVLTMTSRELADLTDKRHDSVKRTIEMLIGRGIISDPQFVEYLDSLNRPAKQYLIGKRDSYVIVAQLSPEFTARLVDRWQELEQANQIKVPQTLPEALRLAADLADKVQEQQLLIEQQKPAVEFLGRYVEAKNTKAIREVAKVLGAKEREFITWLSESKYLFKQGGAWLPYAHYQHCGYFEVKTGESNGHAFQQTRFTPEGIAHIAKQWANK